MTSTQSTEAGDIALLANGEPAPTAQASTAQSAPTTAAATPSQPEPVLVASSEPITESVASEMLFAGTELNSQREIAEEQARRPKVMLPADGVFTSPFAMRWGSMHNGIDIANANGTPIVAAQDGTVIDAGPAQGFGNWVRIKADDGTITTYGHMETVDVQAGQRVVAGQKIAGMGSLGFSTGTHLHFEVEVDGQKIDPLPWLAQQGITVPGAGSVATGSLGS